MVVMVVVGGGGGGGARARADLSPVLGFRPLISLLLVVVIDRRWYSFVIGGLVLIGVRRSCRTRWCARSLGARSWTR